MIHPALVNPFMSVANAAPAPGFPCCKDCGIREPCDHLCPNAAHIERALLDGLRELTQAFEIEPVPTFLTRAHNA